MGLFDFLKRKELNEISLLQKQLEKYKSISDIEKEVKEQTKKLDDSINYRNKELNDLKGLSQELNTKYQNALETYKKLSKEVNLYESTLNIVEYGIYKPVYDFNKSDDYRREQYLIIARQKAMVQSDSASACDANWTIESSEAKGRAVVNKFKKLMLRAFNGECDAMISKVKWNNISQMIERMTKLFDSINKLGEGFKVRIVDEYHVLKIKELRLEHEFQLKKQQEKEEQRQIQEELREEEKAKREFEQVQKEAEKEEANYKKALEKAKRDVEQATGEKHEKLLQQIKQLEQALSQAQEKKERAISMAQQTKRGHVYIISNIGAFGEQVYKIGMTRRLEPLDRVRELGDASVPFQFDVHAMIYSDDAPTLENELHKAFANNKVNMLNARKEFFKVSIDDIEKKISETGIEAEFIKTAEAMEYRETLAILEKLNNPEKVQTLDEKINSDFPSSLI